MAERRGAAHIRHIVEVVFCKIPDMDGENGLCAQVWQFVLASKQLKRTRNGELPNYQELDR